MGRRGVAQRRHKLAIQILAPSQHHASLQRDLADLGRRHARPQQRARHQADAEARQHGSSAALLVGRTQHDARTHAFGRDQPSRLVMGLAGGAQYERRVAEILDRPAIARRRPDHWPPRPAGKVRATRTRHWPRRRPARDGEQRHVAAAAPPALGHRLGRAFGDFEVERAWPCAAASHCMADGHRHGRGEGDRAPAGCAGSTAARRAPAARPRPWRGRAAAGVARRPTAPLRRPRSNRRAPISSSRRATPADSVGWVTWQRSAASVKLPVSATARK